MTKLFLVLVIVALTEGKEINWEEELNKTFERMDAGFESKNIADMLPEVLTADFIRISPNYCVEGDFEKFAALLKHEKHKIHDFHIVETCKNMAVTRMALVVDHEGTPVHVGTEVAVFVFNDGKAKAKLIHSSI